MTEPNRDATNPPATPTAAIKPWTPDPLNRRPGIFTRDARLPRTIPGASFVETVRSLVGPVLGDDWHATWQAEDTVRVWRGQPGALSFEVAIHRPTESDGDYVTSVDHVVSEPQIASRLERLLTDHRKTVSELTALLVGHVRKPVPDNPFQPALLHVGIGNRWPVPPSSTEENRIAEFVIWNIQVLLWLRAEAERYGSGAGGGGGEPKASSLKPKEEADGSGGAGEPKASSLKPKGEAEGSGGAGEPKASSLKPKEEADGSGGAGEPKASSLKPKGETEGSGGAGEPKASSLKTKEEAEGSGGGGEPKASSLKPKGEAEAAAVRKLERGWEAILWPKGWDPFGALVPWVGLSSPAVYQPLAFDAGYWFEHWTALSGPRGGVLSLIDAVKQALPVHLGPDWYVDYRSQSHYFLRHEKHPWIFEVRECKTYCSERSQHPLPYRIRPPGGPFCPTGSAARVRVICPSQHQAEGVAREVCDRRSGACDARTSFRPDNAEDSVKWGIRADLSGSVGADPAFPWRHARPGLDASGWWSAGSWQRHAGLKLQVIWALKILHAACLRHQNANGKEMWGG